MRRALLAALSPLLFTPASRAADVFFGGAPSFDFVHADARRQQAAAGAPGEARFEEIRYREVDGPGHATLGRRPASNVTDAQIAALLNRLLALDATPQKNRTFNPDPAAHGYLMTQDSFGKLMPGDEGRQLIWGIGFVDYNFLEPIPEHCAGGGLCWDRILDEMAKVAERDWATKYRYQWQPTVDAMLAKAVALLKEPHSSYWTEAQWQQIYKQLTNAPAQGIGAAIEPASGAGDAARGLKIRYLIPGSGAEQAGLRAGDVIVAVDDQDATRLPTDDVVQKLLGKPGTTVAVTVARDGATLRVQVTRSTFRLPNIFAKLIGSVGYIHFVQFQKGIDQTVFEKVRELKRAGAKSLVIDVRYNPGGDVPTVASIASEFLLDKDEIVSFSHKGLLDNKLLTDGNGMFARDFPKSRLAVLVNGDSASASEILACALRGHGIRIFGSRSFGKGSQQVVDDRYSLGAMHITENHWASPSCPDINDRRNPDGSEINGTGGVVPASADAVTLSPEQDEAVARTITDQLFGQPADPAVRDEALDKAVQYLSGLR